jgi:hypothetical protein
VNQSHPRFDPLRAPTKRARALLLLTGPLLWVAALVVVAYAAGQTDLIRVGIGIAVGAFLVGLLVLPFARAHRLREEDEPASRS